MREMSLIYRSTVGESFRIAVRSEAGRSVGSATERVLRICRLLSGQVPGGRP